MNKKEKDLGCVGSIIVLFLLYKFGSFLEKRGVFVIALVVAVVLWLVFKLAKPISKIKIPLAGCSGFVALFSVLILLVGYLLKKFGLGKYTAVVSISLNIGIFVVFGLLKTRVKKRNQKLYGQGIYDINHELYVIDCLNGREFEFWCASLLERIGYTNIQVTPTSGDQGADIVAMCNGLRYAIQCKCYSGSLGNKPIQEVASARTIYQCNGAIVMTNSHFTKGGIEAAQANNVQLIDREGLIDQMSFANELFTRSEKTTKKAIKKSKRAAKRYVKQNYSEKQLVEQKERRDNLYLSDWEMMEIDDCMK